MNVFLLTLFHTIAYCIHFNSLLQLNELFTLTHRVNGEMEETRRIPSSNKLHSRFKCGSF